MHEKGPSPLAHALQAWFIEPATRIGAEWQKPYVRGLAELLAHATLDDCVYAGFEFDPAFKPLQGTAVAHECLASIEFSDPGDVAAHRAVCIGWMNDDGARAWVDGVELPVPVDDEGAPQGNPYATGWCAGRYFFIEIGGLVSHPLNDFLGHRLGTMRALLIWDADRRAMRIEHPLETERWTSPRPRIDGKWMHIYATMDDPEPARVIRLDLPST
ncbi:MAG: hypothetical protein ACJ8G7_18085 [Rhizobacter sp.]